MSSVFIRLYLDEDVNVLVADLLNARGFDALTVRDAGQLRASDAEQLLYAVNQQRALVRSLTKITYPNLSIKAVSCKAFLL